MKRTFVEASSFSRRVDREGAEVLARIQVELLKNPESGRVIQGTGGLRLAEMERTYLLVLYDKGEKDDISSEEKTS